MTLSSCATESNKLFKTFTSFSEKNVFWRSFECTVSWYDFVRGVLLSSSLRPIEDSSRPELELADQTMFDSPLLLLLDATHPIFNTNASYVCQKNTHNLCLSLFCRLLLASSSSSSSSSFPAQTFFAFRVFVRTILISSF